MSEIAGWVKNFKNYFRLRKLPFYDVVLIVEHQKYYAHRFILSAQSEVGCSHSFKLKYFKAMFCGKLKESDEREIELKEVKCDVFDILFEFVYTGDVSVSISQAKEVLVAANMFQIQHLKLQCEKVLVGSVNEQNWLELLNFSKTHFAYHLQVACHHLASQNLNLVSKLPLDLMKEFVSSKHLLCSEDKLAASLLDWFRGIGRDSVDHFAELVGFVHLRLCDPTVLASLASSFDSPPARELILKAYVWQSQNADLLVQIKNKNFSGLETGGREIEIPIPQAGLYTIVGKGRNGDTGNGTTVQAIFKLNRGDFLRIFTSYSSGGGTSVSSQYAGTLLVAGNSKPVKNSLSFHFNVKELTFRKNPKESKGS